MLILMTASCKNYEVKDFCGEWSYDKTKFIFHEDGNVEIYNLDNVFVYWTNTRPLNYYKGKWSIGTLDKLDKRIFINIDKLHETCFFIENNYELSYFIGDPDEYNRIVIYKNKK